MHRVVEQLQSVHRIVLFDKAVLCKKPVEFSALAFKSGATFSMEYFLPIVRVNIFRNIILFT
jgi:hypothetical protein